ncbi:MAG TPA: alpha/beta fold hydrolase [Burkholderiaceae bacterium]|nr:alpha/beta fold hydrolase [Burkholderiaceae bacterium]
MPPRHRLALPRAADLRGAAALAVDATIGVADLAEALHASILRTVLPFAPRGERTGGLSGFVYRRVRGTARGVGVALELALRTLERAADADVDDAPSVRREAIVAALNGVVGDRLHEAGNPLAIRTALRAGGRPVDPRRDASGTGRRLLVLVHGLCMNDLQWTRGGSDHGDALARDAGWTTLRLHYCSGRRVADNGRELADALERLLAGRTAPVDEIAIVGHSMGGLVARSACRAAAVAGHAWPRRLSTLVFLGTPHLGAPLERGGHRLERLLAALPYASTFARLAGVRSAGIVDLRHGRVVDPAPGETEPADAVPLPSGVRAYAIAAQLSGRSSGARGARVGDGLVPTASALGEHRDARRALGLPASHRVVVHGAGHWDLLDRPEVLDRLRRWLA